MLVIPEGKNIYVYPEAVDMRKAINGLANILQETYHQPPGSGDFYLFTNRNRDKVKCLHWHHNGFALYYKRLEEGRFNYSKYLQDGKIKVSTAQLKALLLGLDFYLLAKDNSASYEEFF